MRNWNSLFEESVKLIKVPLGGSLKKKQQVSMFQLWLFDSSNEYTNE